MSPPVRSKPAPPVASAHEARRHAILTAPIVRTLLKLALPTITVLVAQTLVGIAETYYVSRLGTDALIGVSMVFPVWMLMTMMSAGGIGSGVASAVARAIGGRRDDDADDLVLHAIVLAVFTGAVFTAGMRLFGHSLFEHLGAHDGALIQAQTYANWLFPSAIPIWIVNLCSAALRGTGNVRTPALVTLGGTFVLIPLSPFFIFGIGGFAGFGIAGAGIAVTIYYLGASLILIRALAKGRVGLTLRLAPLRPGLFRDVLGVGIISSLAAVQLNLSVILVTGAIGRFGPAALAGYGVGARLDYIFIPILFGLGSSVLTMVGTNMSAGQLARARKIAIAGTGIGAAFTGLAGLVVALYPPIWLRIFTHDPEVLVTGSVYLKAVAPFYSAMGAAFILSFVSQGAGRPGWTTFAGTVRLAISAGLGWLAVMHWQASLHDLSLIVGTAQACAAAICFAAYQSGRLIPHA